MAKKKPLTLFGLVKDTVGTVVVASVCLVMDVIGSVFDV